MTIIGLTGSIGMGKTTTASMFKDAGCPVFDADKAVHDLYDKGGEAVPLIRAVFPEAVKNKRVDRSILGAHMRKDPLNLKVLESFIHPMVGKARARFLERARNEKADIIVFDVPLLFETGGDKHVDLIVVVTAPNAVQKERVMRRKGMNEELFERLLSRQMPDWEKRKRADILIFTDKGLESTRKQVDKLILDIRTHKETAK